MEYIICFFVILLGVTIFVLIGGFVSSDSESEYKQKRKTDFDYIDFKDERRWR